MLNKPCTSFPAAKRAFCLLALLLALSAQASGSLSFEERLACQATVEDIRWSETIWPEHNSEPKPDRQHVLSDAQLREKVDDQLRQEAVLFEDYGQYIDAASLQRELDRMAQNTRAPDRLTRRFEALGNDANLIAECLARPLLVQQRLRAAFDADPHHHGTLRQQAEAALAGGAHSAAIEASGGSEQVRVLVRRDASKPGTSAPARDPHELTLDAEDFDAERARLSAAHEAFDRPGLPSRSAPLLRDIDHAFVQETLLSKSEDRLEVQVRSWPKRSFDDWWAERRQQAAGFEAAHANGLKLPTIQGQAMDLSAAAADSWEPRSHPVAARDFHSAVWTGSEMIVWGGRPFGRLNTGVRYDPAIDSWGPDTSTSGAPSARAYHSAVWTGSEMIIWGGFDGSNTNTGGRYNPATDSWGTPTSMIDAPSARNGHSAIWTGSEMIIWGGFDGSYTNTGGRYNPDTDSWGADTSTIDAPSDRYDHSAIWTGSEMIIWGGFDGSELNTGGRYNPDTDSWGTATHTSGAPSARSSHSAIWTGSEMIIWDGFGGSNTGGRYDPDTDSWGTATNTTNAPSARAGHSAVWTGSEMIIWGGSDGARLNTGRRYNPATDSWGAPTSTSRAPRARAVHSAVWTGGEMIVWGGFGGSRFNTGGRYNPATDSWGRPTSMIDAPSARSQHSAIWTGSEMIVWGGHTGGTGFNTGFRYNPFTDSWGAPTSTIDAPSGRHGHSAIWTGSEMIVWGGDGGGNTGGRYNPDTDSWGTATNTTNAPSARTQHSAIWTGSEMIVWGGDGGGNTGGRYDPAENSWGTPTSTIDTPSARAYHSAVWTGSEMIIWGGLSLTDTGGRYDPASDSWGTSTSTKDAPPARYAHSAVWTGREMIVWGGLVTDYSNEMWLYFPYDTASLTTLSSLAPSPSLVNETVMATVQVASTDRAPVDGTVTVTASSGESCSDDDPTPVDSLTVEFACELSFASVGTRDVSAAFSDSSSHHDSSSTATSHTVNKATGTVSFDTLAFTYDGNAKIITATIVEDSTAICDVPASPVGPDAGDYPVTASCEGDTHIAIGSATASIARAEQAAFGVTATPATLLVGGTSTLATQGGSGEGAVSFELTDGAEFCSLDGNILSALVPGDCSIVATKTADANHEAASASVIVSVLPDAIFTDRFD
jgi:hypothetical protein